MKKITTSSIIAFVISLLLGILFLFVTLTPQSASNEYYFIEQANDQIKEMDLKIDEIAIEISNLDTSKVNYIYESKGLSQFQNDLERNKEQLIEEIEQNKTIAKQKEEEFKQRQILHYSIGLFIIIIISALIALLVNYISKISFKNKQKASSIIYVLLAIIAFIIMLFAFGDNANQIGIGFAILCGSLIIGNSIIKNKY